MKGPRGHGSYASLRARLLFSSQTFISHLGRLRITLDPWNTATAAWPRKQCRRIGRLLTLGFADAVCTCSLSYTFTLATPAPQISPKQNQNNLISWTSVMRGSSRDSSRDSSATACIVEIWALS
ncbi:hypothetical protein EJ03DRAFT_160597 [Teratosphaeria nubilosa]|uniref:Uncharacterized protein n=1 Tax=Teratosphaeria nubilosa TaxID=161662 RepID=A0A6G1L387_9PEZI|nr:hypothetical protein EJ03DRAFT_160597 [Teratosphaeria nubilosa]